VKDLQPYLVDDVTAVTLDAAVTLFATGKAAMFPSGTWQVSTFRGLGADLDYDSFDVPVAADWPVDKAVTVGYVDGGWALAARSEHPEQAKRLIDYFSTVEFAQAYTNAMGTIPARSGVTLENPLLASMMARYEENPSTYLGNAYLRFGTPTGTELVGGVVQRLWLGDLDPAGAAAEYQAGLDAWFDPADFASTVQ
ncbi:MAG: extracellular solute-binding protein, partial [Propionicimonas sp.]|nr:extracellular solute-binding protein [Propionicimonas sp.]